MICDHIIWAQLARLSPCCLFKIGEIYIPRLDIHVSKILFGYLFIVQLLPAPAVLWIDAIQETVVEICFYGPSES